MLKWIKD